jgi:hypothetical protein
MKRGDESADRHSSAGAFEPLPRGKSMSTPTLRWIAPALVTLFLSGPALAAAGLPESGVPTAPAAPAPATPAPKAKAVKTTPARKATDDSARYSQREQQAQGLEKWKGGEGVSLYIGSTVLAVALVVVLLLVLL